MASIQFRGLNQVIKAFEDRGAEAWSVWDGKAFLFRGIGSSEFTTLLESLDQSGSTSIYTLKVYDEISDAKKIKPSSECDGSFNFRLLERDENGFMPHGQGRYNDLERKYIALEEKFNQLMEQTEPVKDDEESPETGLMGVISGLLQDPDKLEKLIQVGHRLLGGNMQAGYVGNVNKIVAPGTAPSLSPSNNSQTVSSVIPDDEKDKQLVRLGTALDTLEKNDPQIVEHLEKLAAIAVTKPEQFKVLIGMLDLY